ncbi:flavin reductase family protein [Lacihabitans sp. CCS-44]|uniref:flavin reductase family protein n=1 Tax=Lacihabitans sp. CCS-44 TaxID=2487331 RepID=UPI0020CDE8B8|nr:flavin reductase family protein [Lacihabitans sp. CCS-44]MCP9753806.1 flavin reductase family protein [Lacihabitans sp. CCS-44]
MKILPGDHDIQDVYKILTAAVTPRPIGWISSVNNKGERNLAPFSFFNVVGYDPPHVIFAPIAPNGIKKDTTTNVLETGEFVVNMVTENLAEQMNKTSARLAPDEDEFAFAGLTAQDSILVKPPRVKESPISFECKLVHHYSFKDKQNGSTILIGQVVMIHVADEILLPDFKINTELYKSIGKMEGGLYCRTSDQFFINREVPVSKPN